MDARPSAVVSTLGLVALMLLVLGTVWAVSIEGAYDGAALRTWYDSIADNRGLASGSAWAFAGGLWLLVGFYAGFFGMIPEAAKAWARPALVLMGAAAMADSMAALAPALIVKTLITGLPEGQGAAQGLLWWAIAVDGIHNMSLAVGLLLLVPVTRALTGVPRWLVHLQIAAAVFLVPAGLQGLWPQGAMAILVGGSLWLVWLFMMARWCWEQGAKSGRELDADEA